MERHEAIAQRKRAIRRRRSTLRAHRSTYSHPLRRSNHVAEALAARIIDSGEAERQAELEHDLQLARDIQQGLLLAAVPSLPGWELSAVSNPARDLGGDLYDFLELHDGSHGIMIGDVSGKGLPAALRMAVARTMFRYHARQGLPPGATLAAINDGVCSDIPQGMVTMLYLRLHPTQGTLHFANAGHTYPLLLNGRVNELELTGVPLGVLPEMDYAETMVTVNPGDSIILYTDGVTEATNHHAELFGSTHLYDLLATHIHLKPRALMRLLLTELRTWSDGQVPHDDITLVILRRRYQALHDELRSIATDILGTEAADTLWHEHVTLWINGAQEQWDTLYWIETVVSSLTSAVRATFNRGLARELNQQLRLAIEDYRGAHAAEDSGER